LASLAQSAHQDLQDPKALQAVSTKSTDQLDLKELQDHPDLLAKREPPAKREPTVVADQDRSATTELQDHQERQAHKAHLDHQDQPERAAAANTAHHHVLLQAIKWTSRLFDGCTLALLLIPIKMNIKNPNYN